MFAARATSEISVTITADRGSVAVGRDVTYRARMTNHGPNDATFVDLTFLWPKQLDEVSMACAGGISPDGPSCEYSSLKAGRTVVTVLVATPHPGGHPGDKKVKVTARASFEVDCSLDPNCTFDPNGRNNAASILTKLVPKPRHS